MTVRTFAHGLLWFSVGCALGSGSVALVTGEPGVAVVNVITAAVVACVLWFLPKVEQRLDAQVGEAIARREIHEHALAATRAAMTDGRVRVGVNGDGVDISVH